MINFSNISDRYRSDIQACVFAVLMSAAVMIAELGGFTFVSDIYHIQLNNVFPNDGISADARFFPELLFQTIFCGTYLPSIFLLMLTSSLAIGGHLMIRRMNILSGNLRVIPMLVLILNPFLFSHSAYIVNRLQTSSSILFATLAAFVMSHSRWCGAVKIILSGALLSLSLMSFQPAIGIFWVCALFLCANAVLEQNLPFRAVFRQLISIALSSALALAVYEGCVLLALRVHLIEGIRVHSMMSLPVTTEDAWKHAVELAKLLKDIVWDRSQFFPSILKWLFIVNLVWLIAEISKRSQTLFQRAWRGLFIAGCFFSFYFSIIFVFPIIPIPRIMPGLAFSWFFVFLFLMKFGGRVGRSLAMASMLVCIVAFSIQFNIMHERLAVKNEIDKNTTWQIIHRIQAIADQSSGPPTIALVGVLDHHQMPYWPKYSGVFKHHLVPDILQSVYQFDWSKYRLLEFYYQCKPPDDSQAREAAKLVQASPLWPEEGSVIKGNGFIAVALSRP